MTSGLAGDLLAVSILLAVGLAAAALPRRSAAERHWLLAVCTACALAFPALRLAVPAQWAAPFESPRRHRREPGPHRAGRAARLDPRRGANCCAVGPRRVERRRAAGDRHASVALGGAAAVAVAGRSRRGGRPTVGRTASAPRSHPARHQARPRPVASSRRQPRRDPAPARAGAPAGRRRSVAGRDLGLESAADPAAARGPLLAERSRPYRRRA